MPLGDLPVQRRRKIVEVYLARLEEQEGEPGGGMRGHPGGAGEVASHGSQCSLDFIGAIRSQRKVIAE